MLEIKDEICVIGLTSFKEIIEKIINSLKLSNFVFEIKLILTEALNNAFIHGNLKDKNKPIFLRYLYDGKSIKFEIQDSGLGFENVNLKKEIQEENLLEERGRGLFLIYNLVDKFEVKKNILIIEKNMI